MNGNQEMGGAVWGRSETEAIHSSTSALAEVIYVGRASFRVALEIEAPAPAVDTKTWFHSVEGDDAHEPVVLTSGPRGMATSVSRGEPNDFDAVPILYDSEVVSAAPRRRRTSRWTIGLPLAFGGFFCGILMSPLVSPVQPEGERGFTAKAAPTAGVVLAPVPPAVPPAAVAPIISPTPAPEPAVPPVTVLAENLPNRLTTGALKPLMPVQGRVSAGEKSGGHKLVPRHSPRIASSPSAAGSTAATWVDPWADNK
jgi:hypothetical protein